MEITVKGIAALTGATIEGDENAVISSFSPIEKAGKGDITFLANPKYTNYLYTTEATAVLINENVVTEKHVDAVLLRVRDPYAALAILMQAAEKEKFRPQGIETPVFLPRDFKISEGIYIGAFSYISEGVDIGADTLIYPQCFIGRNVVIGKGAVIYAGVKVYDGCKIGNRCVIHSGSVIGSDGFGFAPTDGKFEKIPQIGNVILEDDVEIGANTTIDRATFGSTIIGKGSKLDNLMQVAHNVQIGENNVFAAQTGIAGSTHIGNFNYVGGQCGFAGHIKIGNYNQFGAQSGIPNNVGDGKRLIGYPAIDARQFAKNQVYLKRLGDFFADNKNKEKGK